MKSFSDILIQLSPWFCHFRFGNLEMFQYRDMRSIDFLFSHFETFCIFKFLYDYLDHILNKNNINRNNNGELLKLSHYQCLPKTKVHLKKWKYSYWTIFVVNKLNHPFLKTFLLSPYLFFGWYPMVVHSLLLLLCLGSVKLWSIIRI